MSSSILFRLFAMLLIICSIKIIRIVNGVNASAAVDNSSEDVEILGTFDTEFGNLEIPGATLMTPNAQKESNKSIANVLLNLVPKLEKDSVTLSVLPKLINGLKMFVPLSSPMTSSMDYTDSTKANVITEDDKQLLETSSEVTRENDRNSQASTTIADVQNESLLPTASSNTVLLTVSSADYPKSSETSESPDQNGPLTTGETSLQPKLNTENFASETVPFESSSHTTMFTVSYGNNPIVSAVSDSSHNDDSSTIAEIPTYSGIHETDASTETNQFEQFRENITIDINTIVRRFVPFISLGDTFIFVEQQRRTNAFIACCQVDGKFDETILKKYVDAYGSALEQNNIINGCSKTSHGLLNPNCMAGLSEITDAQKITKKFLSMIADGKKTKFDDLMQWLEYVVLQLTHVKNVIHGYTGTTKKGCNSHLSLLWNPEKLIECETNYRSAFPVDPATAREYQKFNDEISKPFQEQALSLMTNVNNIWREIFARAQTNIQANPYQQHVSKSQIESDMNYISNLLTRYAPALDHSMTAHYSRRAHAYRACCGSIETPDMFSRYLTNFEHDPIQIVAMDQVFQNCNHMQGNNSTTHNQCYMASILLEYAMQREEKFIREYGEQNPEMHLSFEKAIQLKEHEGAVIQEMAIYVKQYCPNRHVFELMYDYTKNVACESLIHNNIPKNDPQSYSHYSLNCHLGFGQWCFINDYDYL